MCMCVWSHTNARRAIGVVRFSFFGRQVTLDKAIEYTRFDKYKSKYMGKYNVVDTAKVHWRCARFLFFFVLSGLSWKRRIRNASPAVARLAPKETAPFQAKQVTLSVRNGTRARAHTCMRTKRACLGDPPLDAWSSDDLASRVSSGRHELRRIRRHGAPRRVSLFSLAYGTLFLVDSSKRRFSFSQNGRVYRAAASLRANVSLNPPPHEYFTNAKQNDTLVPSQIGAQSYSFKNGDIITGTIVQFDGPQKAIQLRIFNSWRVLSLLFRECLPRPHRYARERMRL